MTTRADVADQDRRAVVHGHDDVADVLGRLNASQSAHVVKLAALRVEAAAGVAVVRAERADDQRHRQADRGHLRRIEQHLILHRRTAEAGVVRDAGNGFVLALDHPILERLQLHRRAVGTFEHVAENQSRRREERRHARRDSVGQRHVREALQRLLAREVAVRPRLERQPDVGQTVERDGADDGHVRDAVHLRFHRHGDQPLDLLGGVTFPLRHDLDRGGERSGYASTGNRRNE